MYTTEVHVRQEAATALARLAVEQGRKEEHQHQWKGTRPSGQGPATPVAHQQATGLGSKSGPINGRAHGRRMLPPLQLWLLQVVHEHLVLLGRQRLELLPILLRLLLRQRLWYVTQR